MKYSALCGFTETLEGVQVYLSDFDKSTWGKTQADAEEAAKELILALYASGANKKPKSVLSRSVTNSGTIFKVITVERE